MEQRKLNKLLKKEIWEFWLQTKLSEVNSVKNSAAAKDIMSVLGMIKRTFSTLNKETFLTLYSTYIKPHLEHCIQVWAPYFNKDIDIGPTWEGPKTCYEISLVYKEFKLRTKTWIFGTIFTIKKKTKRRPKET